MTNFVLMNIFYSRQWIYIGTLVSTFLLQSCGGVYNYSSVDIERALEIKQPVRVKTNEGAVYKLSELQMEETDIFGVAREKSNTARKHEAQIVERNYRDKYVKIEIPENSIEEIRTKNRGLSILVPLTLGVAIITTLGYLATGMGFSANL